ncbi:MAG: bifunctional helix-turn-helix domain-containing protein/methylated-DNA--[protein]-cysteine S-methyltransferase [Pseudomonadota bacterium]
MTADTREGSYHYGVMRRAIDLIDSGAPGQTLADLAAQMQMSPAHFQRLFSQWVGISPKKYQQYLMLEQAKTLLTERFTTLGTAQEIGLSGAGRLHDLFLRWEAMSPGEYARRGEGLVIRYGFFESPFGEVLVMGTDRGICGIGFTSETGRQAALDDLSGRWPDAVYREDPAPLEAWTDAAFGSPVIGAHVPLYLIGAPFQIKVWEALLQVPSGHVTSYSEIAQSIGHPNAVRAVGTAVGRNPISFLIPCHRALRKSGGLGGYHWGLPVKRAMLAWESARADV